ncbi:MAG: hypothetical protein H0V89_01955, partial [Deltaproteobacteria bacterium]|nr:hypothetical protein [Deltaproteobacteria bacterium]
MRQIPRMIVSELIATVRTALFPITRLHRLPTPGLAQGRAAAVLVHGFLGHRDMLRPLARRLLREGWT